MTFHPYRDPRLGSGFGSNLRDLRLSHFGMDQATLAARIGCSPTLISHFEAGRRLPSLENFVKLCNGLGCSADTLLRGSRRRR